MLSLLAHRSRSFQSVYRREVEARLRRHEPLPPLVSEADLSHLPAPVQAYVRYSGAIGRPQIENFRAVWRGAMRLQPDGAWLDFSAEQHDFISPAARFFLIEAKRFLVPFDGLHAYVAEHATMKIRLASLFDVVNAHGPEMDHSETVTLFNDWCVLAPAALTDPKISWVPVDSLHARASFSNAGQTISALLTFNERGELTDFSSDDRSLTSDGKRYERYPWSTPLSEYRSFDGRKVASRGLAVWQKPQADYCYGRFELLSVEYNR